MFSRRKGLAAWMGEGEPIDPIANEASLPGEHLALRRPQISVIKSLDRSVAAEHLFGSRLVAWSTVLFC